MRILLLPFTFTLDLGLIASVAQATKPSAVSLAAVVLLLLGQHSLELPAPPFHLLGHNIGLGDAGRGKNLQYKCIIFLNIR